jgi:hypothetical protein
MGLKTLFLMNSSRRMRPDLAHPTELAQTFDTGDESRSKATHAARSIRNVFRRHAHRKIGAAQSSVDPEPGILTAPATQCYRFQVVQQQVNSPVYHPNDSTSTNTSSRIQPLAQPLSLLHPQPPQLKPVPRPRPRPSPSTPCSQHPTMRPRVQLVTCLLPASRTMPASIAMLASLTMIVTLTMPLCTMILTMPSPNTRLPPSCCPSVMLPWANSLPLRKTSCHVLHPASKLDSGELGACLSHHECPHWSTVFNKSRLPTTHAKAINAVSSSKTLPTRPPTAVKQQPASSIKSTLTLPSKLVTQTQPISH